MKSFIKPVILFLALLLPVCVFIFLKIFGANQFDIPLYYQTVGDIPEETEEICGNVDTPYLLNLDEFELFESTSDIPLLENRITVLAYLPNLDDNHLFSMLSMNERLGTIFQMIIFTDSFSNDIFKGKNYVTFKAGENVGNFWQCGLLNNNYEKWVLIDTKRRIRGYYEVTEKEIDRLIVEIKILSENSHK
ncbi:MAG: hypothetical protein OEW67_01520 [Cyclobacteriaceae bacterium]|nr:hypothetical protein [Cyclobacteriaceae bacterium]